MAKTFLTTERETEASDIPNTRYDCEKWTRVEQESDVIARE